MITFKMFRDYVPIASYLTFRLISGFSGLFPEAFLSGWICPLYDYLENTNTMRNLFGFRSWTILMAKTTVASRYKALLRLRVINYD